MCDRAWDGDATFCGACGARLDPGAGAGPTVAPGRRRGLLVGGLAVLLAVGAALAIPRVDLSALGGGGPAEGDISLPGDARGTVPTADPTPRPTDGPLRCTRDGAPVTCVRWEAPHDPDASLGPRIAGILTEVSEDGLVLRDTGTGVVRWRRPDLVEVRVQAHADGVVVIVSADGRARGLDLDDGSDRWTMDGASVGVPGTTPGGHVVLGLGSADGPVRRLAGVDPRTGEVAWEWAPPWDGTLRTARPALGGDVIVVMGPGEVAAIDGGDGATRWHVETLADGYPTVEPPGHVTVQQLGAEPTSGLWVHDADTGEVVHRTEADTITGLVVVDGAVVTHRPVEQEVRAVDLVTGEVLWTRAHDGHDGLAGAADPADTATAVVLRDEAAGTVTRLAPRSGDVLWEADVPLGRLTTGSSTFLGQPQLVDDLVVVEDGASVVTVLDVGTGAELVRIDGGAQLDVRSFSPLTLVRGDEWFAVQLPDLGSRVRGDAVSGVRQSRVTARGKSRAHAE